MKIFSNKLKLRICFKPSDPTKTNTKGGSSGKRKMIPDRNTVKPEKLQKKIHEYIEINIKNNSRTISYGVLNVCRFT